ncbi:multicopper oxidase-domain-containing protein [Gilbertella persicaria]|uniref:multicopper oxidase-domain-containing protein n=1 Tax=Gilbertella persicaria TaxID=101096 RepID=UPI00221F1943|nr:multicopper oxidase-domain-containing protein [Gilbertella persicaria]KAI8090300.1 multicopper oxidase-domain-containing protein [Gilbertella persicaria]
MLSIILLLALLVQICTAHDSTRVRKFELTIKSALLNPDCSNQSYAGLVINDQYPGPALHLVKNDIVQIKIRNDVGNNVSSSVHFHGIRQINTNNADGVAAITQLAVAPGEEYVQTFQVIDQSGTFYYHAHVGVQDDTIQGPFVVHDSEEALQKETHSGPYPYDGEFILQWAEWWHQSIYNREAYYLSPSFTADGGPDSVLLNGQSVYHKMETIPKDCKGFTYFDVEPNKTYRLRIIGAVTYRVLGMFVKQHNMTLIELDGEYVQPYDLDSLELHAGQRMSVLIHTGNYSAGTTFPIVTDYRWRSSNAGYTQSGYGFLRYVDPKQKTEAITILNKPLNQDLPALNATKLNVPSWVLPQVKPHAPGNPAILNGEAHHTIVLDMKEVIMPDNTTRFILNNRPYNPNRWGNATASLYDFVTSDPDPGVLYPDGGSRKHHTYPVGLNQIVDFVFQSHFLPTRPDLCVAHPWHTHGYSHYLIAEGSGDYVHERDKDIRTYTDPLYKDVSIAYPRIQEGAVGCGWTKVRIFTVGCLHEFTRSFYYFRTTLVSGQSIVILLHTCYKAK